MHHAFTSPTDESLPYLETDKAKVKAKAYDLVLNGIELSSGSIRITDPELQTEYLIYLAYLTKRHTGNLDFCSTLLNTAPLRTEAWDSVSTVS